MHTHPKTKKYHTYSDTHPVPKALDTSLLAWRAFTAGVLWINVSPPEVFAVCGYVPRGLTVNDITPLCICTWGTVGIILPVTKKCCRLIGPAACWSNYNPARGYFLPRQPPRQPRNTQNGLFYPQHDGMITVNAWRHLQQVSKSAREVDKNGPLEGGERVMI